MMTFVYENHPKIIGWELFVPLVVFPRELLDVSNNDMSRITIVQVRSCLQLGHERAYFRSKYATLTVKAARVGDIQFSKDCAADCEIRDYYENPPLCDLERGKPDETCLATADRQLNVSRFAARGEVILDPEVAISLRLSEVGIADDSDLLVCEEGGDLSVLHRFPP
jgi:hypothetical protein